MEEVDIGGLVGFGQDATITSSYVGDGVTVSATANVGNGNAVGLLGAGSGVTIKTSYSAAGSISANGELIMAVWLVVLGLEGLLILPVLTPIGIERPAL